MSTQTRKPVSTEQTRAARTAAGIGGCDGGSGTELAAPGEPAPRREQDSGLCSCQTWLGCQHCSRECRDSLCVGCLQDNTRLFTQGPRWQEHVGQSPTLAEQEMRDGAEDAWGPAGLRKFHLVVKFYGFV